MKKIVAVTGCPTGIAHTYMAEEALKKAAKELGVEIKIETNGAVGVENELAAQDIEEAIGVIIACDKDARVDRFVGKRVIEASVKDGVHKAKFLIEQILEEKAPIKGGSNAQHSKKEEAVAKQGIGHSIYKHLMNGVSHMLPLVVAGGVLIAISFLWGIHSADPAHETYNQFAAMLKQIGGVAFGFIVPVFTAYIASSISGRPGLIAGFVGGMIANDTGAGFLGGIVAGFFAGYLVLGLIHLLKGLPRHFEGLKSIFILPIIGVLLTGMLMLFLGEPVAAINNSVMGWLAGLQNSNAILLGIIIGCMCAFDFGGPVNKAAYVTGTMLLAQGNYYFMAGVSAACITPPLVIALATTLFKNAFDEEERAAGLVNYILGFTHITEGAIPFAAKDPLRVIPMLMFGSAISAILTYLMQVQVPAPHGGFLVLPVVTGAFQWVLAIFIGSLVGAVIYGGYRKRLLKK